MRNLLLIAISFVVFSASVNAQQNVVTGKVTGAEDGVEVIGATIVIKGKLTFGTITNFEGNYSIEAGLTDTLVFSFVGFSDKLIPVAGRSVIDVIMEGDNILIDEVVVTALGMKRDKKALGYSVQEVGGEELKKTKELNVINSLSGKVAGVNITQGGGGLNGGGARIVIRGETSLAGNNTPLFVIDGIPGGSNDVATDDIESTVILKGPAAAALYGSRAAAGVVLITTKSGAGTEGIGVEFNANISMQTPFVLPNYQNEFGQGTGGIYRYYDGNNGVWPDGSISNDDYRTNWGPRFDGELRNQFTGLDSWIAYPDNVKGFYETGYILNNNVAVSGANEDGNIRLSYTNVKQNGIIPNTEFLQNRLDFSGGWNLTEKLRASANVKYSRATSDNNQSENIRLIPRNIDVEALKDYWVPGLEGLQQLKWRASANNPYFNLYENTRSFNANRLVGSTLLDYKINEYLSVMGRVGMVQNNGDSYSRSAFSSVGSNSQYGSFGASQSWSQEINMDFLMTFEKDITNSFNLKAAAGGNKMRNEGASLSASSSQLLVPDIYNLGNYRTYPNQGNSFSEKELNSLYGFANLAYKGKVYMDVTARNDWSSTLPSYNNSYFYPSFTLSGLMDKIFQLPQNISFWKIRGNWAKVGNDTSPYQLSDAYYWGQGEGGVATISQGGTKANPDLKPELTSAWEAGTDIRFFNNRLKFDVTYYNSLTSNQILRVEVSPTTGYNYILKNAGEIRNRGWEVMVRAVIIESNDFSWDMTLNWSRDRAFVEEYDPDNPEAFLSRSVTTHLFVEDRLGERRGAMYGKGFERAPNGEMLFTKSGDTQRGDKKYLGNYNPDWMGSMSNDIRYKDVSLSFLLDVRFGGVFYSRTNYDLNIRGLSEATLLGGPDANGVYTEREYILPDGMYLDDGEYRKLTREDLIESGLSAGGLGGQSYWENMMDAEIPEAVMYDASYLKLRELRLAYNVPKELLSTNFIQSASVSMVVRNLAVWSHVPNVDPETFSGSGQAGYVPGYDSGGVPSVRNISMNINLRF